MSLRLRLALANAVVFSLCLLAVGLGVQWSGEQLLRRRFDDLLVQRAERLVETLVLAGEPGRPPTVLGHVLQVRAADGGVLHRSPALEGLELPLDREAVERAEGPSFESVRIREITTRFSDGSALRVLTLRRELPGTGPVYVQVGISEEAVDVSVSALRRTLLLSVPIGLLLVVAGSWWFAGRALHPVKRLVRAVRQRGAEDLDTPLPVPAGGDEFAAAVVAYNGLLARIHDAFEAQRRFTANAAHELRSPVSRLLGHAQVLRQRERPVEEHAAFAVEVEEEMRRLARTVESLLVLARVDADEGARRLEPLVLGEVLREAFEKSVGASATRRVRLDLPDPESEPELHGDPELLRVAIENLLRNAFTHSPEDGVVEVGLSREGTEMRLRVRDHGPGFPLDRLPWRFERFQTGSRSGGTGLGLALVEGVARRHGGRLEVGNAADGGAECVLHLPVPAADPPRPAST